MIANSLNKFIDRLRQHKDQNLFQNPLLTQDDIELLRHLAHKPYHHTQHKHEVAHLQYGDIRSIYRGYGLDYEESRPYQSGDEMRFMNWRLSARSNQLYMKVFREERRPSVFILVDRRQSMRFGSHSRLKVTQATRIATYLAFIAKQNNSPIAGVVLNEVAEWVPEAAGETGVFNLLSQANKPCPPLSGQNKELSLNHTLRLLLNMLTSGSIIYLISDFHDLNNNSNPLLMQLSEEHRVIALNVSDSLEKNIPNVTNISIFNPDTHEDVYLCAHNKHINNQYNKQATEYFSSITTMLSQHGIEYVEIGSELTHLDQKLQFS